MPVDSEIVEAAAENLLRATVTRSPIEPLTTTWPDLDADTAYAIQQRNVARRLEDGHRLVGHKVGLTAKVMQELLGVSQPDFGCLLDDMAIGDGDTLLLEQLIAPRAEPEIAFVLGHALTGPTCTGEDVLAATDRVAPALEIIDSRIRNWAIRFEDTVADNASAASYVLGPSIPYRREMHLEREVVELLVDDEVNDRGTGGAVLGHPANAVAWLVNTLYERGVGLAEGAVVMPGSCTRAADISRCARVEARFATLGSVAVRCERNGTR